MLLSLDYHNPQQQQLLPNSSRLCGVWGDPDVHDLAPMRTRLSQSLSKNLYSSVCNYDEESTSERSKDNSENFVAS